MLLLVGVAACSSAPDSGASASPNASASVSTSAGDIFGPHNAADAAFAAQLIAMADQGLTLGNLAEVKSSTVAADGKQFNASIKSQQEQASAWIQAWGPGDGEAPDSGPLSETDFRKLATATGSKFDKLWQTDVDKFLDEQKQAAEAELTDGTNEQARALAKEIVDNVNSQRGL